MHYSQ